METTTVTMKINLQRHFPVTVHVFTVTGYGSREEALAALALWEPTRSVVGYYVAKVVLVDAEGREEVVRDDGHAEACGTKPYYHKYAPESAETFLP